MTAISDKGPLPDYGAGMYEGFDHIHWWVGNARMFADWWVDRFGFTRIAYRGLETGSRDVVTHVISNGRVVFAVSSQLNPVATMCAGDEMGRHLAMHGDGVKDVAFRVTDCARVYASLVGRGGVSVSPPTESVDAGGRVIMASVATYGDTIHTLVERKAYHGPFLPGYRAAAEEPSAIATCTPKPVFEIVDHVVGNQPADEMTSIVEKYSSIWQFHVMEDWDETIKMPINEPAGGKKKSQIQEYVEYYGGAGVQHIALLTEDIIETVTRLRARGVVCLSVPAAYYDALGARLARASIHVKEDLRMIRELGILVDFDDKGYLLQLFTKPLMDRPTVFIEIIQRAGNKGFGAGNFKALFESIEREQALRGNLT